MKRCALVTGSSGFVGRHLCRTLKKNGWKVIECNTEQYNLCNSNETVRLVEYPITHIFHLATYTKAGDWCLTHQGEQWLINQQIHTNMLRLWKEFFPRAKMITYGTSCAYDSELGYTEDTYLKGHPRDEGLFTYAMSKRILQTGLEAFGEQHGMKWLTLIPSTLYGPGFNIDDSHFIFDLIKKIHICKSGEPTPVFWGDGTQKRELVYIDDAIEATMKLLPEENKIINLAAGADLELREFVRLVSNAMKYSGPVKWDVTRYVGAQRKYLNGDLIQKLLGSDWQKTPLPRGIIRTVEYYESIV